MGLGIRRVCTARKKNLFDMIFFPHSQSLFSTTNRECARGILRQRVFRGLSLFALCWKEVKLYFAEAFTVEWFVWTTVLFAVDATPKVRLVPHQAVISSVFMVSQGCRFPQSRGSCELRRRNRTPLSCMRRATNYKTKRTIKNSIHCRAKITTETLSSEPL